MGVALEQYEETYRDVGHPERVRILVFLLGRPNTSPTYYWRLLDREGPSMNMVSHHFVHLRKKNLIEETDFRRVRGAVEHFYSVTERGAQLAKTYAS